MGNALCIWNLLLLLVCTIYLYILQKRVRGWRRKYRRIVKMYNKVINAIPKGSINQELYHQLTGDMIINEADRIK